MFGDVEGSLNAWRGFVSISWASCYFFGILWSCIVFQCVFSSVGTLHTGGLLKMITWQLECQ